MRPLLLFLTTGAAAFWPTAETTNTDLYPKNPNVDVVNYAFHIGLSDDTDRMTGRAVIDVAFKAAGERQLRFDLVGTFEADAGERGMRVLGVRLSGGGGPDRVAEFTHEEDELRLALPAPSAAGDRVAVSIEYEGIPASGLRIGPNKYGDRTFFSDNWPNRARNWLPTVDHPYDKATNEFIVTAPNRYQVISNGLLIEETDLQDGNRRTHWKQSVPIPPWLYVLGVADFAVQHVGEYEGKAIQTWVYARDRDAGFYDFAVPTKRALEFYGDYVGPYAYEKLANVQAASVGGGMEAATAIFYGENSVTGERSVRWRNVIIHEVAHQWFGNAVTEYDWDDVWLSEGFATYFTLLFIEHAYGRDEFVAGLQQAAERVWAWYADNPDYRIVHDDLSDMSRVTSVATYQKGAWVLHMLRELVGDDAFWSGIRAYYAAYMNANATTDDFRQAMEEASQLELGWFFEQWLYRGGNPKLRGTWRYDRSASAIVLDLEQGVDGNGVFRLLLDIGVRLDPEGPLERHAVELTSQRQQFTLPVAGQPYEVVLDPNTRALFQAEFVQVGGS